MTAKLFRVNLEQRNASGMLTGSGNVDVIARDAVFAVVRARSVARREWCLLKSRPIDVLAVTVLSAEVFT